MYWQIENRIHWIFLKEQLCAAHHLVTIQVLSSKIKFIQFNLLKCCEENRERTCHTAQFCRDAISLCCPHKSVIILSTYKIGYEHSLINPPKDPRRYLKRY